MYSLALPANIEDLQVISTGLNVKKFWFIFKYTAFLVDHFYTVWKGSMCISKVKEKISNDRNCFKFNEKNIDKWKWFDFQIQVR